MVLSCLHTFEGNRAGVLVKPMRAELPRNGAGVILARSTFTLISTLRVSVLLRTCSKLIVKRLQRSPRTGSRIYVASASKLGLPPHSIRAWKLARHVEAITSPQTTHQRRTFQTRARASAPAHSSRVPKNTRRSHGAQTRSPIMARHLDRRDNDHELARVHDRPVQLHKRIAAPE